jgi:hypothetical protein
MPPLSSTLNRGKRICVVGDPGCGKTSLLGQAARHYEEFILDTDDLNIPLQQFVPEQFHERIHLEQLMDQVTIDVDSGRLKPIGEPKAWKHMINLLRTAWVDSETKQNFGNVQSWGPDRILALDSFTHLAVPCWNFVLYLNTTPYADRFVKRKRQVDWGDAIDRQMAILHLLTKGGLKCHVIINTHLKHLTVEEAITEDEATALAEERAAKRVQAHKQQQQANTQATTNTSGGAAAIAIQKKKEREDANARRAMSADDRESRSTVSTFKRYPVALGQKLPENFGSYFDFVVQAKRGKDGKPYIQTTPDPDVDLKCPALSSKIPAVLLMEDAIHRLLSL